MSSMKRVAPSGRSGWRRLRPLALGAAAAVTLATAGCGEKPEPTVHAPTTAPTTAATPTTTIAPTQTKPRTTPTAPVPKQTP